MIGSYLSNYTSGHSDARKMQEMYNNPSKYTYDQFKQQLGKAKYKPDPRDYSESYGTLYRFGSDERKAEQKYNADYGKYLGIRNSLLLDFKGRATPAPAPAAAPAAQSSVQPKLDALDNKYRKESEALLKKISDMETQLDKVQRPKTIFAAPSAVSAGNLQIAPAAGVNRAGGTSSFKRRTTSPSTSKVRTIQSLNV